jgi:hypothetical protein
MRKGWGQGEDVGRGENIPQGKNVSLGMEKETGLGKIRSLGRRHVLRYMGPGKRHSPWRRWVQGGDGIKERMWVRENIP